MSTGSPHGIDFDPARFAETLPKIAEQSQRIILEFLGGQAPKGDMGMSDASHLAATFAALSARMIADPMALGIATFQLWSDQALLWQKTGQRLLEGGEAEKTAGRDRRFKDASWSDNAIFDYLKQSYLVAADSILSSVRNVEGLDRHTAHKAEFYTRQFVDAISPSNFIATNPEVLKATLESGGENLLRGLSNLLSDLERGQGRLAITMADTEAFSVGGNLATTPGKVVDQNDLMQLIQYAPATEKVRKRPLLIVPPWINKFYVLDLKPQNSLIRWAVAQGHTVFVISWANPDERLSHKGFDSYMLEGPIRALDVIEEITGERSTNAIGYCLGGTLLASTLAWFTARGESRIASATYFVTLVDFTDVGDMAVFIDEEQLEALERRMRERGFLEAHAMADSFNMLRANDLIWSFVVSNYLLGKEPLPFDLLYWNADATRMPAAMHSFYLRKMYHENLLARPGGITLAGVPIDLRHIRTPTFLLSTREDHIAPWRSTYRATQIYGGPVTFVLSASGHMAGVISAPGTKYGHWVNPDLPSTPEEWFERAQARDGSWWPLWDEWVSEFSDGEVAPRAIGSKKHPPIEDAPGSYVRVRSN